jgi:GH24 family phage-related lysozyme (muramidase)
MSSRPVLTLSNPSVVSIRLVRIYSSGYLYELQSLALGSSTISVSLNGTTKSFTATVATPASIDKYAKTTTGVNLRSGPGLNYSIYYTVQTGTTVKVLDTSNPEWTKVQTPSGQVGYLYTEYIAFISNSTTSSVSLSNYSGTIPAGKTFYITATTDPDDADVTWNTSDASVATVSNGYIYAVAPGTATITASSGGRVASCKVTVTQAEPVRIAYTYPNIAGINSNVELTAITDATRDSARFIVKMKDGSTTTLNATSYTTDGATRVWKASMTFPQAGVYDVTAYSSKNGVMSSTGASTTAFISSTNDFTTTTVEERRVSDKMVDIIKAYEGYSAAVYVDTLAYNIPTIGYGHVVRDGEVFYNNLTQKEATALLINNINERTYTTEVNKFILNNHVKTNQNQFDAMVSFSYNIGAGYWNGTSQFDLKNIMLNGVVPPTIGSGLPATTTESLNVHSSASMSASTIATVSNGSNVTVLQVNYNSATKLNWYQIRLSNGTEGWVSGAYVRFASSVNAVRDLNYVDATQFGNELMLWHHAGGKAVVGLLYRRLAEAKVFSFGNYEEAMPGSANYKHNTYQYTYPPEFAGYEQ